MAQKIFFWSDLFLTQEVIKRGRLFFLILQIKKPIQKITFEVIQHISQKIIYFPFNGNFV